jgi:L-threonylcarbamoyladenylate synthase
MINYSVNTSDVETPWSREGLRLAAELLRGGGLVAFATETVYGLGADALNPAAVAKIFAAKQRPAWDPLIVHIASYEMLSRVVTQISPQARSLMRAFWPGPLTLLLPRTAAVQDAVTAGRPLVGVRWPQHPVAQALILAADCPVAAPSANLFSHVSPTTAQHVLADLNGRIDMLLDSGPTTLGLESAVVDPNTIPPTLYRPGTITTGQMEAIVGPVQLYRPPVALEPVALEKMQAQPSPGGDIRHYAPRAQVLLVESEAAMQQTIALSSEKKIGVLLPQPWSAPESAVVFVWGDWNNPAQLAANLYAGLRTLDEQGCDRIVCPVPAASPENQALRDRLYKSARS